MESNRVDSLFLLFSMTFVSSFAVILVQLYVPLGLERDVVIMNRKTFSLVSVSFDSDVT